MIMEWTKWKRRGQWVENDEGYHMKYCHLCAVDTEHELGNCLACENHYRKAKKKKKSE